MLRSEMINTNVFNIGYGMCVFNPNISTFKLKFGWTPENESNYIALISLLNPLGATFGSFIAKHLVLYMIFGLTFKI